MTALNLIRFSKYEFGLDLKSLIFYALGTLLLAILLILYYKKIPKSKLADNTLQNPIYESKDILLQPKNVKDSYLDLEDNVSVFTKIWLYIIIAIVCFTPLYKLLGTAYFV